jgi:cytoskeletal protein RodZ
MNENTTIPELEEYYAEETKKEKSKAWLVAGGSLLATLAIIGGIFLGGRWIYNTVTKEDAKTVATNNSTPKVSVTNIKAAPEESKVAVVDPTEENQSTPTPTSSPTSTPTSTPVRSNATATPTTAPATPTVAPAVLGTGNASTNSLPNTGAGSIVAIFATALISGYSIKIAQKRRA